MREAMFMSLSSSGQAINEYVSDLNFNIDLRASPDVLEIFQKLECACL